MYFNAIGRAECEVIDRRDYCTGNQSKNTTQQDQCDEYPDTGSWLPTWIVPLMDAAIAAAAPPAVAAIRAIIIPTTRPTTAPNHATLITPNFLTEYAVVAILVITSCDEKSYFESLYKCSRFVVMVNRDMLVHGLIIIPVNAIILLLTKTFMEIKKNSDILIGRMFRVSVEGC